MRIRVECSGCTSKLVPDKLAVACISPGLLYNKFIYYIYMIPLCSNAEAAVMFLSTILCSSIGMRL